MQRPRHLSQVMLAERLGTSVMTVRRMESGHPGIAMQYLARALHVFGELEKKGGIHLTQVPPMGCGLHPRSDGMALEQSQRPVA